MPEAPPLGERPIAVIGGGLIGLSAAFELVTQGRRVVVFEASASLGGKIAETSLDGTIVPTGPDAFLARRPEVTELATELGLTESLTSPVARSARIYRDGVTHPLPPNVLGVPATADLTATGLISPAGARIAAEGVADSPPTDTDESVGSLVRRQLGDEVLEFLVDPLLGGINAGDTDRLSVISGVPQLDALRKRGGRLLDAAASTIEEAAARAVGRTEPAPVFHSIEGGLGRLIERLTERLIASGRCELRTNTHADVSRTDDGWTVDGTDVDHVISTIPAFGVAGLLAEIAPEVSDLLSSIDYSSVALAVITLAPETIDLGTEISGVLIPRTLGHHITAISFASHKWPTLAIGGRQVLRVSVGRRTDERWMELSNDELVTAIEHDLSEIFGTEVNATNSAVTRWVRALPQYDVGHRDRIDALDQLLDDLPGLHLTGAWRDGLGLPACVAAGRNAAQAAINA